MTKPIFIYFHGAPGSAQELDLVTQTGWRDDVDIHIPYRHTASTLRGDALYEQMAEDIRNAYPNRPLRLIGFSLGGMLALRIVEKLGEQVEHIDLIAPAAPLELGDFLADMVGKPVFELAMKSPRLLSAQVQAQRFLVRFFPNVLYKMVFSSAVGADIELANTPEFKTVIIDVLRTTVSKGSKAYVDELCAYVQPWAHILKNIKSSTTLWHGDADNWAPIAMSEALQKVLPNNTELIKMQGLSHYSALIEVLPKIMGQKL